MEALRTPDERFSNLPGFGYAPRYRDDLPGFEGLRFHYVDEGPPAAGRTFLCLHGQPTWAYLWRRMVPVFVAAGARVIAPDLFGFGRSDKPTSEAVYTFSFHRDTLMRFVERLDLRASTLVVHDWGGLIGLTLPMDMPGRFTGLVVLNTALATGDVPLPQGFLDWRAWSRTRPDLDVARLMGRANPHLSGAECAAYAAPFPDPRFKAGVRRFPNLVPDRPDADGAEISRRARSFLREAWTGPAFMAVGMKDPVLGPLVMSHLRALIRGCPPALELPEAGHFVPEWGEEVARAALTALPGSGAA